MEEKYLLGKGRLFFIVLNTALSGTLTSGFGTFRKGGSAALTAFVSGALAFFALYFVLTLIEKREAKSVLGLAKKGFRLPLAAVLGAYLIFSSAEKNVLFGELLKKAVFPTAPSVFVPLVLTASAVLCVAQGFDAVSRLHMLFVPVLLISLAFTLVFPFLKGSVTNVFPLFGQGISEILGNGIFSSGFYGDVLALVLLFPFGKEVKSFKKVTLSAFLTGALINLAAALAVSFAAPAEVTESIKIPYFFLVRLLMSVRGLQSFEGFFVFAVSGSFVLSLSVLIFLFSYLAFEELSLPKLRPVAYSAGLLSLLSALVIPRRFFDKTLFFSAAALFIVLSVIFGRKRRSL